MNTMAEGIRRFLASVNMERHVDMFVTRGFDEESDIPHLGVTDLHCIGIHDPTEVVTILKAAMSYKLSQEHEVFRWLRDNGLVHYWEGFVQSHLTELSQIRELNLPDEDLYDELEITLPGHKRRLERAVNNLRKRQRRSSLSDVEVVTEGWWGYPEYLQNAKYPFLCVQATIGSTASSSTPSRCMDFMIDSGSDVSTLRDDVIRSLDLEEIGSVNSVGVYGSQRTTMYKARLTLGDTPMEIEVISSSYDSLGSRVLRHFRHRIDSSRHIWFRGSRPIPPLNVPEDTARVAAPDGVAGLPETVSVLPGTQSTARAPGHSGTHTETMVPGQTGTRSTTVVPGHSGTHSTTVVPGHSGTHTRTMVSGQTGTHSTTVVPGHLGTHTRTVVPGGCAGNSTDCRRGDGGGGLDEGGRNGGDGLTSGAINQSSCPSFDLDHGYFSSGAGGGGPNSALHGGRSGHVTANLHTNTVLQNRQATPSGTAGSGLENS